MSEYLRPWKLFSLACGIALLIAGAFYYEAPDWDVPISLIMALLAYLTAPWSMRVILERQWKKWPVILFATSRRVSPPIGRKFVPASRLGTRRKGRVEG